MTHFFKKNKLNNHDLEDKYNLLKKLKTQLESFAFIENFTEEEINEYHKIENKYNKLKVDLDNIQAPKNNIPQSTILK